jgi:hypothetical protein
VRAVRILYLSLAALVACSPNNRDGNQPDAAGPDAPSRPDAPPAETSRVYAHSGSTLFRIDTQNLGTIQVGAMTGLGTQSLTDLAIDKNDHIVGITLDKLYTIDATTGAVTLVKDLSQSATNFTSLSFVPKDLNDPASDDILVSANSFGDVFQIDPATGTATKIGSYGSVASGRVGSSGDLVAVRGLGIYATVDVGTAPDSNDYLAVIDPLTWTATPLGTGTGFNNIFGLGYWAGKFYGFVDDKTAHVGKIIEIDPNTGKGTEILSGAQEWYGAGVTTDAPVLQ